MSIVHTNTLIIGAGQAGLAASEHLSNNNVPHIIAEKDRIAESWRTRRWDSLVANGPAWHDRFPTREFTGIDPDSFATKDQIVDYFSSFAEQISAPVRTGTEIFSVSPVDDGRAFRAESSDGAFVARNIVVATGAFQKPAIPPLVPSLPGLVQIHSESYRNPAQLPEGAVLVVGAGSSGVQIADELARAGRRTFLSVGPHNRPPRRYRGRDFVWWLGALGQWDATTCEPNMEHVTIAVSGARGGHTVDFRSLAASGITLLGTLESFGGDSLRFAPDLERNIAQGDADYLSLLDAADAYIAREGLDLPEEPDARKIARYPLCVTIPIRELGLRDVEITAIVWATGYSSDFGWLKLDAFDSHGQPRHRRGVSVVPGLYFLGLPWLSRRASPFIWGTWHDAQYVAAHIAGCDADAAPAEGRRVRVDE